MRILLAVVVALAWAAPAQAATVQVPPRFYTHDPAVSIAITADDGATLTCRLAAADAAPCTSPWQPQVTDDGAYAYTVTATDAGDSTAEAQGEFVLDRVAPQITVTGGHITVTDVNLDRSECAADDGPYGPCPDTVPAGVGSYTIRAYDKAGNAGSQVTGPAPTVSAPDPRGEGGILDATAEHVHAKLTVKARHTRAFTRLTRLRLTHVPPGIAVTATCHGGGCPTHAIRRTAHGGAIALGAFLGRKLKPGATITVTLRRAGKLEQTLKLTIRRTAGPRIG